MKEEGDDDKSCNFSSAVGREIRARRSVLKISQESLASRAGLHRTYISDVEAGRRNLTLRSLLRISKALEFLPSDLLTNVESRLEHERNNPAPIPN